MKHLAFLSALAIAAALILGGTAPLGRLLLVAGMPSLAVPFFQDPEWRGVAQYRSRDMDRAAESFVDAGAHFNAGNAKAKDGAFAAALEAYDLAIATGDGDARANFDVVSAYYAGLAIDPAALGLFPERKEGPTAESFVARGDGRAAGTGDEATNTSSMLGLAELESRGRLGVRRIFDDKFMAADERWLQQLQDVPGAYLSARIAMEHKRRMKEGLSPPPPEDKR